MKLLKFKFVVVSIVLAFIVSSMPVFAETVTLSCDPYEPYHYGKIGAVPTGPVPDIVKEVFKRLKMDTEMKLYPWKRCLDQMKKGKRDGIFILSKNKEREAYMVFTVAYLSDNQSIYYLKGKKFNWKNFKDLKPYTIGLTSGYNYGDKFPKARKKLGLKVDESAKSDLTNFKKLIKGRIDIFPCNDTIAKYIFKKNPELKGKFSKAKKPINKLTWHMSFSKKSKISKMVPKINKTIKKMQRDGTVKKILAKY